MGLAALLAFAGAALTVGANIGTTSTRVLAVIGATSSAKRAAVSHLLFTLAGGSVALSLLRYSSAACDEAMAALQNDYQLVKVKPAGGS